MKKIVLLVLLILNIMLYCNTRLKADNISVIAGSEDVEFFNEEIESKSAILIEPITKTVLYQKNATDKLAPASMTKMMTMILVCEALENNTLTLNQMLTTSKYASSMGGTQIYLKENEQMSVEDLLKSVAIASANDAAVVLAEGIAGSCRAFVSMMNKKGKEIGFVNTNFVNPNGLPEENHYSCAYDMALAGCYLLNKYSDMILKYTSCYEDYVREDLENKFWLVNTNKLIRYEGIDGLKTGMTEEAGYCLTCTMNKNNIRMVSVVMGAESIKMRTEDTLALLNYGVNTYELSKIYSSGEVIESITNKLYSPEKFDIIVEKDIYFLKKRGKDINNIKIEKIINYDELSENNYVGEVKIYIGDVLIDTSLLKISSKIKKANVFILMLEILENIFY